MNADQPQKAAAPNAKTTLATDNMFISLAYAHPRFDRIPAIAQKSWVDVPCVSGIDRNTERVSRLENQGDRAGLF